MEQTVLRMVGLAVAGLPLAAASSAAERACPSGGAAYSRMVQTEFDFAKHAEHSVRGAFLEYLADDSLVFQPGPRAGRPVWAAAKENPDRLEWYPVVAEMAPSADFGFTSGPWTYTAAADGSHLSGYFLTVWKRDAGCRWHVAVDGGVEHPAMGSAGRPNAAGPPYMALEAPSPKPANIDRVAEVRRQFEGDAQAGGVAAALRKFASPRLTFYADGAPPMDGVAAAAFLNSKPPAGQWQEAGHGLAGDASLAYAVGDIVTAGGVKTHGFYEIWRYESSPRQWRLRVLLITAYPPPQAK